MQVTTDSLTSDSLASGSFASDSLASGSSHDSFHRDLSFRATIGSLLAHGVAQHPDMDLVVLDGQRITFAEAEQASRDLAKGLLAAGVGKGTRVGLLATSGPNWVVSFFAINRIGAVAVLLNTYLTAGELGRLLRNSDVQVMLVDNQHFGQDYLDRLEELAPELQESGPDIGVLSHPYLRSVWVWGDPQRNWAGSVGDLVGRGEAVSELLLEKVEEQVVPADWGVVLYSSGSTAEPKGAIHTQGAIVMQARNVGRVRDVVRGDVIYSAMPMFWVGGLIYSLGIAMHAGATVVYEQRFDPKVALATLARERCTHVLGYLHVSSAIAELEEVGDYDLSRLRRVNDTRLLSAERRAAIPELQALGLGMTETLGPHSMDMEGEALAEEHKGSYGRAVAGFDRKIVDPQTGAEVAVGERGELLVRGHGVMQGLYKREREDTFWADGWYPTGDGASIDAQGHLYFFGRMGTMIKTSGMNVVPREVELVLETHREVRHAHVYGVTHPKRAKDVAALVVTTAASRVTDAELAAHVRKELSTYKVPRHFLLVDDEKDLAWKGSGKIDEVHLAALLEEKFGTPTEGS